MCMIFILSWIYKEFNLLVIFLFGTPTSSSVPLKLLIVCLLLLLGKTWRKRREGGTRKTRRNGEILLPILMLLSSLLPLNVTKLHLLIHRGIH